ncbi:MAG: ribosome biogenesis GTP-binding protein YihA/YsxC [Geminicoccaceae bacterium]|nr:ribosome biogenesis GTP-binding protein YihA/YsxC [Geminicoccaceae bacterium]
MTPLGGQAADVDPDPEAIDLEPGRRLFAHACTFVRGVADLTQLPDAGLPEVAFAGRSNVGKSSLVNALTGRGRLARTSNTPGRTQEINFFELAGELMLVDLPGYGFAQAPRPVVLRWQKLVRAYLQGRSVLRRVCVLIDARHGPKDVDRTFFTMLADAAVSFQLVLTKGDLVRPGALADLVETIASELQRWPAAHPEVLVTSARTGDGMALLRAQLARLREMTPS